MEHYILKKTALNSEYKTCVFKFKFLLIPVIKLGFHEHTILCRTWENSFGPTVCVSLNSRRLFEFFSALVYKGYEIKMRTRSCDILAEIKNAS